MSEDSETQVSVISNYPELYLAHPSVIGKNINEPVPCDMQTVNLGNFINPINNETGQIKTEKLDQIYMICGIPPEKKREPKLYLTNSELERVSFLRRSNNDRMNIGVVLRSRFAMKNWNPYTIRVLIEKLAKDGNNVYIIDKELSDDFYKKLPVQRIVGLPIRDLMVWIAYLDLIIAPDTGIPHIANALGTKSIVVSYPIFEELYNYYTKCSLIKAKENTPKSILRISEKQIISEIRKIKIEKKSVDRVLVVRFRGFGDVLLLLPVIATLKKNYPNRKYDLLTSKGIASLLRDTTTIFDNIIGMDYNHHTSGEPPLPSGVDCKPYDAVFNLINRIDFIANSDRIHRTELFAQKLGLDSVDYSSNWKLEIPLQWRLNIRKKLSEYMVFSRRKLIVIQVDSKGASRLYPRERLKELIGKCLKHYDVALTSDVRIEGFSSNTINLTGKLSLEEYVSLIADCDVFVGADSSGVHIAGCVGTKAIGLYGSVDPKLRVSHYDTVYPMVGKCKYQPCNDWQKHSCCDDKQPLACMWYLLPRDIFAKIQELLTKE